MGDVEGRQEDPLVEVGDDQPAAGGLKTVQTLAQTPAYALGRPWPAWCCISMWKLPMYGRPLKKNWRTGTHTDADTGGTGHQPLGIPLKMVRKGLRTRVLSACGSC